MRVVTDRPEFLRLTDAANVMEAGALQALLQDNGIDCYIKGENHAALFGSFAAAIGFDVMVRYDDLERARDLVEAFRHAEPLEDLDALADESPHPDGDAGESKPSAGAQSPRKAATLAIFPSVGFGHFYTGAFQRGIVLAAAQLVGVAFVLKGDLAGLLLWGGAIATDAVGSVARARALTEAAEAAGAGNRRLPEARVVPSDRTRRRPGEN